MGSSRRALRTFAALVVLLGLSCVGDRAPTDPAGPSATAALSVVPTFTSATGATLAQDRVEHVFDRISCFRLVAVRVSNGREVARETFRVQAGRSQYELSTDVDLLTSPESFRVTITAYASAGDDPCGFELFSGTQVVSVRFDRVTRTAGSLPSFPLSPSGPQVRASELRLTPGHAVLSGGGTASLEPALLDASGGVIAEGEDLASVLLWESSSEGTASVDDDGTVTGSSDGTAEITAATVTDLSATAPVYVATSEFAYVRGGELVVTTVDGAEEEVVASNASRPAWGPDGALAYAAGGSIQKVDGGTLLPGAGSPTFRPTGTHVSGSAGGGILHATSDGEFVAEDAVEGPGNPQWIDQAHLVGDGGSIVRVRADGTERTELTSVASDRLPSVGGGRIAFLSDRGEGGTGVWTMGAAGGALTRITPESFDATGRPSISGSWILVPGSGEAGTGIHLVPADGSSPPLLLSIEAGTDPAWKTAVPAPEAPPLEITAADPLRPRGGDEITLSGSGFDWLVPEANTVEVPVLGLAGSAESGGTTTSSSTAASAEVEILEVGEFALTFQAPLDLSGGTLRAATSFSETTFELDVPSGTLEILAESAGSTEPRSAASGAASAQSESKPVDDIAVELRNVGGQSLGSRSTDDEGRVVFEGLPAGDYVLALTSPEGFEAPPDIGPVEVNPDATTSIPVSVTALPWTLALSRSSVTLREPGATTTVDASVADIDGDPTDAALSTSRSTGSIFLIRAVGLQLELEALAPGTASATITASRPSGTSALSDDEGEPVSVAAADRSLTATLEVTVRPPPEPEGVIHEGDYIVEAPADLDAFQAEGYTRVEGSLSIRSSPSGALTDLSGLETLEEVTGDVIISHNSALTDISGLANLTTVGGDLRVVVNSVLTNVDGFGLATLQSVGGTLEVADNPDLEDVNGFSGLTTVGERLEIARNASLMNVDGFSSLTSVGAGPCPDNTTDSFCGDLALIDNPNVSNVDALSSLQSIGGGVVIEDMTALTDVDGLSSVTSIENVVQFLRNPALVSVAGLSSANGAVRMIQIVDNDALLDLEGLEGIGSVELSVEIQENDGLESLDGLSGITSIGLDLIVENNPSLESVSGGPGGAGLSGVQTIGHDLSIRNAPLLDDPETLPALTSVGGFVRLHNNPGVRMIFPQLSSVGGYVSVMHDDNDPEDGDPNEPEFSGVTAVMEELSLPRLSSVGGYVRVRYNPALTSVEIASDPGIPPVNYTAEGFFVIDQNEALSTIDLNRLQSTTGSLQIKDNAVLATLDLSSLGSVGSSIRIERNGNGGGTFTSLDLSSLSSVTGFVRIQENDALTSVDLSSLTTVGQVVQIQGNDALGTAPGLTQLGDDVSLMVRGYDPQVEGPAGSLTDLGTVGGAGGVRLRDLAVENNPDLTSLNGLSNVTEISGTGPDGSPSGDLDLVNNASLSDMSALSGVPARQVRILDNPALSSADARSFADAAGALAGTMAGFVQIHGNRADPLTSIAAGIEHTCAIASGPIAGTMAFCWGPDDAGARGVGGGTRLFSAVGPQPVAGVYPFVQVAPFLIEPSTCAITGTGAAYCWGRNSSGQIGDGTGTDRLIPTPVSGGHSFDVIETGDEHVCGLTGDGEIYCWGDNGEGQLGDGTTTDRSTPTLVSGGHVFTALAVGGDHTCAVATDGETYCWGWNVRGQIGDGTNTNRPTPTAVSTSETFVALTGGARHTCAIASDGAAWCWGEGTSGQLGNGAQSSPTTPVEVDPGQALAFGEIDAGGSHTCGVTTGGVPYCWGANFDGQLGDGTTTGKSVPAAVTLPGGVSTFSSITGGLSHSCAMGDDGQAYCWGRNTSGQLGIGSSGTDELLPTAVDHP